MISHGFRRRALFHEKFLVGSITYFRNVFFSFIVEFGRY